jgi:hypothetical protein
MPNYMRTIILFIFLISTKIICGQKDSAVENRFCINSVPLSLIDLWGGNSYRIEAEYKLYRNIAHTIEIGKYFGYSANGFFRPIKINPQGYIIRTSVKLYLNKKRSTVGQYLSLEYLYKNITFDYQDSIIINPEPAYKKQYKIHKEVSAITIKYGTTYIVKKRYVIDLYVGAGARFFTNGYNTLTPEEEKHIIYGAIDGDLISSGQRMIKNEWVPNINAGLKLGYRIK